jgi:chromosome segregation ATPase
MKKQTVLTGLIMMAVLTLVSACQQDPQMVKRAQLIGDENHQLKKQIEQKKVEIAALKQQIEQAQQEIQNIQEQLDKTAGLVKQADAENLQLKDLSLRKDAEITNFKQQVNTMNDENMRSQEMMVITQLMKSLSECQQKLAKYEPVADANIPAEPNQ